MNPINSSPELYTFVLESPTSAYAATEYLKNLRRSSLIQDGKQQIKTYKHTTWKKMWEYEIKNGLGKGLTKAIKDKDTDRAFRMMIRSTTELTLIALITSFPTFQKLNNNLKPFEKQKERSSHQLTDLWENYLTMLKADGGRIRPEDFGRGLRTNVRGHLLEASDINRKPFTITSDQILFKEEHGLDGIHLHKKQEFYSDILYRMNSYPDDVQFDDIKQREKFPCSCGIPPCKFINARILGLRQNTHCSLHCKNYLTNKCEDYIHEKKSFDLRETQINDTKTTFLHAAGLITVAFLLPFVLKMPEPAFIPDVINLPISPRQTCIRTGSLGLLIYVIRQTIKSALLT